MQKLLFRIFALVIIFIASLGFFIATMKENSLTRTIEMTEMSDVSLPVVSVLYKEDEINFMYGYVKDTFPFGVREDITPVGYDGELYFMLYHYGNDISSAEYEINNRVEKIVLETGKGLIEPISDTEDRSKISINIDYDFSAEAEYGLKLILMNKDGKKTYYYTTLKYLKEDRFKDNLKFVKKLRKAIFNKKDDKFVKQYLETNNTMDNMSFNHVNIHSSYDLVSWGDLAPEKVSELKVSVLENNQSSTSLLYKYVVSVGEINKNYYYVTEFFRVNSYGKSIFLLAYDRRMEEVFYPEKISVSKKQLKFGIGEKETNFLVSTNKEYISFVRERELWQYQLKTNILSRVFSFRKDDFSVEREILDRHKVKVLRIEDNGDLFFAVYGYMNRGVYEGRNGVVIYKYHEVERRIEELVFFPADKFHKELIHDIDKISYLSADGFFYFTLDGTFYSYSLVKKRLDVVSENPKYNRFFVLKEGEAVVWQEESGVIQLFSLRTRQKKSIQAEKGKILHLFTSIDSNIIYGIVSEEDIRENKDGSLLIPSEKLLITDFAGKVLKEYEKKNVYVVDVGVDGSVINLKRLKKLKDGSFNEIENDQILNNIIPKQEEISIIDRRLEKYLTEYYLKLPKNFELTSLPTTFLEVKNTVIISETTVKFPDEILPTNYYYTVIQGKIHKSSDRPAKMIEIANKGMGYVIDNFGVVIWERGKTRFSNQAEEIDLDYADEEDTEKEAAIRLFLTAKGIYISDNELKNGKSILDILMSQPEIRALDLMGISLEEVLYYVSEGSPVIGMMDDRLVIIVAYQSKTLTIMNVKTGKTEVISREEAEKLFKKAGNRFISAIG